MEINQAVLDADGYAQCPDCGTRIHCGTVGLVNLEKRHRGKKICLETKAKRDKNMKTKKNGTLLSFFNQPKTSLVPSTIPAIQPVLSPALPQEENTPNTETAVVAQQDGKQGRVPIIKRLRVSPFVEKLTDLATKLPHTIPEASDNDKLSEFGQDPANFDDNTINRDDLWEEEINPRLKRVLGWGTEGSMKELIRRGKKGVEGLAMYVGYFVEERGVNESLFEGKLSHLMMALEEMCVKEYNSISNIPNSLFK